MEFLAAHLRSCWALSMLGVGSWSVRSGSTPCIVALGLRTFPSKAGQICSCIRCVCPPHHLEKLSVLVHALKLLDLLLWKCLVWADMGGGGCRLLSLALATCKSCFETALLLIIHLKLLIGLLNTAGVLWGWRPMGIQSSIRRALSHVVILRSIIPLRVKCHHIVFRIELFDLRHISRVSHSCFRMFGIKIYFLKSHYLIRRSYKILGV